jgi:hypothetical protein
MAGIPTPGSFNMQPEAYRYIQDQQRELDAAKAALATAAAQTHFISVAIGYPEDKDYPVIQNAPFAMTIDSITTKATSGTCTLTGNINTTALGGTANSVSSTENIQAHSTANAVAIGDDFKLTVSANAACVGVIATIAYRRA